MHLLAAQPGAIDDGEAVDLGQTPAELVVISAADTELAALSEARAAMDDPPGTRLASLMHLRHPMSVDLHLDACATRSKLVVARVLGGRGYWSYGLEQYAARLHEAGVPFAALPGDDKPDAELRALSTVAGEDYDALWSCLVEGGSANATTFLAHARAMVRGGERPGPARPLLRAGLYWPGEAEASMATLRAAWTVGAPVVPLVFYRALLQGAGLAPVNRMVKALLRAGLNPMPVFVASLKDPVSRSTLEALLQGAPPDAILNLTSFAVGDAAANPLAAPRANGAPVFQAVLSSGTEAAWAEGTTGLPARDVAMNVALPELDGRVLTRAIGFKGEAFHDEATQCRVATWRAHGDRIAFVARLVANWCRLRRMPPAERRVALVLANYPDRDGRLANGVGLDTPAATVHVLRLLRDAGYAAEPPADGAALMARLMAGPTNRLTDRAERTGGERLSLADYRAFHDALPLAAREALADRWGAPEDDPFYDAADGAFALSIHRLGRAFVAIQPARGYAVDPTETYHSPDLVPPHAYLAFHAWLRREADAVVHMGKHGNLEWLPGRALALGADDWPEIALGPMPNVYPFIVNDPGEGTQAKRRAQAVIVDHLTPPLTRAESYGPMRDLEALVDEYYEAAGVDPRRIGLLRDEILDLARTTGLDVDAGMDGSDDLSRLDAYLCELKEAQIRDGLHVFGQSPEGGCATTSCRPCSACRGATARARPPPCPGPSPPTSRSASTRSTATWPPRGTARARTRLAATIPGAAGATRWSGSRFCPPASCAARLPRPARRPRPSCATPTACARRSTPAARRRARRFSRRSTGARSRPARPARRRAAAPTCCRPGATSTPSTAAPSPRRPRGSSAGVPPRSSWSGTCRITATGRARCW